MRCFAQIELVEDVSRPDFVTGVRFCLRMASAKTMWASDIKDRIKAARALADSGWVCTIGFAV
jgi:hypothetical protein